MCTVICNIVFAYIAEVCSVQATNQRYLNSLLLALPFDLHFYQEKLFISNEFSFVTFP